VATVAVLWGVFSREALDHAGPDFSVATPAALADLCLDGAPAERSAERSTT
jgi:phosphoglycolate phosphatase-like HAD superfamily hydrolase